MLVVAQLVKNLSCQIDTSFTPFCHCNQVSAVYNRTSLPTYAFYTEKATLLIILLLISINWSYGNSWYLNYLNVLIIAFITFEIPHFWFCIVLRIKSDYLNKCDYVT